MTRGKSNSTDDTTLLNINEADYGAVHTDGNTSSNHFENHLDPNLYLYQERLADSPRVATLLHRISNYQVVIPTFQPSEHVTQVHSANLGTFFGVYLPCIQNILGIIFFIRLAWIVSTAGVFHSFLIAVLCCSVTFATCISLSAIATNGLVPAGGSYFMISRSMGPEFGGAVGILFFLATTFAAAMYITGAIEILLNYMAPQLSLYGDFRASPAILANNIRTYGTILLAVLGLFVLIGVKFVSKFAPIALLCVILSILCTYIGVFINLHGKQNLEICVLGGRILKKNFEVCSKDPNINGSLYHIFCKKINSTDYECDEYFNTHEANSTFAIPGLISNAFYDNYDSRYRPAGSYISLSPNPESDSAFGQNPYNEILVDISTSFTVLLAIFFSSCTGILAGSNRSGDLEDAQRSIPLGTISAQLTTSAIYISGVLLFGATFDNLFGRDKFGESIGGKMAVAQLAWPHPMVIVIGSFLSTFGAALQSLIGAPRLLHAIALDNIIPILKPFKFTNTKNEPVYALIATLMICEIGILIGNLDYIAPVLTMFFLMSYMFVNLACTLQSLLRSPNWRPRFKYYHWSLSLLGVLLCLIVMFLSSWFYAVFSMILAGVIYKYIEFRGAEKEWGDGIHGLALSAARYSLLKLEEGPPHTKNWRPQLLVLCKLDQDLKPKHPNLFAFASQLKAGNGLTLVSSVLEGEYGKMYSESQAAKQCLKNLMEENKVKGFGDVIVANDVSDGIGYLIQGSGLGGMKHNTVLVGWPYGWRHAHDPKSYKVFFDTVKDVSSSKNALLVIKGIGSFPSNSEKLDGTIDVWWILHEGGLLLLLPFLLKQHKVWKNCRLRIFTIAQAEDDTEELKKSLTLFLYQLRIEGQIEIVEMANSDISDYTYERTLIMEQRNELMKQLHASQRMKLSPSIVETIMGSNRTQKMKVVERPQGDLHQSLEQSSLEELDLQNIKPDQSNVQRMHTAVRLNEVIVEKSHKAQLVILNLPGLPNMRNVEENYMEFLEVLTEGLDRVLMVRGGGREVITIYS